jgi:hypothetical protein
MKEKLVAVRTILVLIVLILIFGCFQQKKSEELGTLKGHVTVAPLCPVEPCNLAPGVLARAFDARKIVVYGLDGMTIVKVVDLKSDGSYETALNPGTYIVDINKLGMDSSSEVPKEIAIEKGKTVELDVNIDTGIR